MESRASTNVHRPRDARGGGPPGPPPSSPLTSAAAKRLESAYRVRRKAALRLGPYAAGPADPLDGLAGLPIPDRPCCRAMLGADGRWRQCCRAGAA
jgi:hypothetical protein